MARLLLSTLLLIVVGSFASAQGSYQIQPGDVLSIEVLEDPALNRSTLVLPDGTISFPLVGSVAAGGRSLSAVQAAIVAGLSPNFASAPNVFVNVQSLTAATQVLATGTGTQEIYIIGAVTNPGRITVPHGTSLLQFLAESGGLSQFAAKKRIQLRRTDSKTGKTMVFNFNFKAIEDGSAGGTSIVLQHGDVIVVPERRLFE